MEREKESVLLQWVLGHFNSENAQAILDQFKDNADVEIQTGFDEPSLTEEETKILVAFSNGLQEKGCTCKFAEGYTIPQAIAASRRLNSWVDEIKNAKVDGRELTNFEKYAYAFEIVTDFVYNMEKEGEDWKSSRRLVQVLTGDKIVCAGYATLLHTMLQKLEIPSAYINLTPKEGGYGHAACAVYIEDEKYGMKNVMFSDPTFGSKSKERPKTFLFMVMSKEDAETMWDEFKMDFEEIRKDLKVNTVRVERQTSQIEAVERYQKLFENDMQQNLFDATMAIDALMKVFQSQGLSLDAASTIASARFWGESVQQIMENRKITGNYNEETEQELTRFAQNKKDYSKPEKTENEQNVNFQ